MEITRQIDVFDRKDENLVQEIQLNDFNLDKMKQLFNVQDSDPLMYMQYEIKEDHISYFPGINFNFEKHQYFLACFQK